MTKSFRVRLRKWNKMFFRIVFSDTIKEVERKKAYNTVTTNVEDNSHSAKD